MSDGGLWPDSRRSELLALAIDQLRPPPTELVVTRSAVQAITIAGRLPVIFGPGFAPVPYALAFSAVASLAGGVGPGGVDASGGSGERWMYGHLIRHGLDVAAILSASAIAPAVPVGWRWSGCVTAARVHTDGNFLPYTQVGRTVQFAYTTYETHANGGGRLLESGHATTYTAVDCSKRVPLGISRIVNALFTTLSDANQRYAEWRTTGLTSQINIGIYAPPSVLASAQVACIVDTAGSIDYRCTGSPLTLYIDCGGFTISSF